MVDSRVNPLKRKPIEEVMAKASGKPVQTEPVEAPKGKGSEVLDDFRPLTKAIEIPESITMAAARGTKFERKAAPKSTRTKFKTHRTIVQRIKVSQKTQDDFRALSDLMDQPLAVVFEEAITQMLKRERKKRISV